MNIVLVGAGEVGFNLSKVLSKDGHNLTIIDINESKCSRVNNSIDAKVIEGNGASQRILQMIEMTEIDYFLALTPIDEINLIACKTASIDGVVSFANLEGLIKGTDNPVLLPSSAISSSSVDNIAISIQGSDLQISAA